MTLAEINPPPEPWRHELRMNADGDKVLPTPSNVALILSRDPQWEGCLAYDLLSLQSITTRPPPWPAEDHPRAGEWQDVDDQRLACWLSDRYGIDYRRPLGPLVDMVSRRQSVHPVRDWLDTLRWDGTPRSLVAHFGCADSAYTRSVLRWMLISAVARVYQPGCKVDTVTILEGPQGARKSTAVLVLCGHEWFIDTSVEIGSKDSFMALRGKWFVELAELDSFGRAEASRAKSFFSSRTDDFRPPFGRRYIAQPRQCIFVGTTNETEYLRDATGARRYLPVRCESIDVDAIARDRDQLWAEAVQAYRAGERWWPDTGAERAICGDEQEARYSADAWEAVISRWMKGITRRVTVDEVASTALGLDVARLTKSEQIRVGTALRRLGCRVVRVQDGAAKVRMYEPARTEFVFSDQDANAHGLSANVDNPWG